MNEDAFFLLVGTNIKTIRQDKGLTMEELGFKIGVDRPQVHRMEAGQNLTLRTILKLSKALEIKPYILLK